MQDNKKKQYFPTLMFSSLPNGVIFFLITDDQFDKSIMYNTAENVLFLFFSTNYSEEVNQRKKGQNASGRTNWWALNTK